RDARTCRLGRCIAVLEASNLGEAAGAVFDVADAVFERLDDVCTADLHGGQGVGEGQDSQHVTNCDFASIDGSAYAAAILEGDGGALIGDAIKDGVGEQVAHGAFLDAADFAGAFELVGGGRDDRGGQLLDGAEECL